MPRKSDARRAYEAQVGIGVLRFLTTCPDGEAPTRITKLKIHEYVNLSAADMELSQTRTGESLYKQIVGNVVSHRNDMPGNIIYEGYAEYLGRRRGVRVTKAGREHLKNKGY